MGKKRNSGFEKMEYNEGPLNPTRYVERKSQVNFISPGAKKLFGRIQDDQYRDTSVYRSLACERCHAPRRRTDLRYTIGGKFICIHEARCDKELAAYEIANREDKKGVAIRQSQAHNEHKDGGLVMGQVEQARELLGKGVPIEKIRKQTGLGIGTIYRIRDDPTYAPSPRRQVGTRQGAATRKRVVPTPDTLYTPEQTESLKTRLLAAISARHPDRFQTAFELRNVIARPGESIDGHAVTHVLFTLRGGGWIKFKEVGKMKGELGGGGGGQNIVTDIRLTEQGYSQIRRANGAAQALRGDFPPTPAVNAPPAAETPPVAPTPAPAEVSPQGAEDRDRQQQMFDTPQAKPGDGINTDHYPLIRNLILRPSKIAGAAKLLREAGMDEAATLIEAEQKQLTPLELEILALLKAYDIHPTR